ncbi:MAG: hypothetical protein CMH83_19400 [Nocardioides sp.]|nr:hypothetical protein [Nocardioides sp.]
MTTRRESVQLILQDDFTTPMAKAAVATAMLRKELKDLDGTRVSTRRATNEVDKVTTSADGAADAVDRVGDSSRDTSKEIDQLSGRVRLLRQTLALIGPAVLPIGAVAAPAITTLATAATGGVVAVGSLAAAFQGVGDAVKALDEYQADPTLANLQKSQEALAQLGPDARAFVAAFDGFQPTLTMLRDSAAAGWFPGLIDALEHGEDLAPKVARLLEHVSEAGAQAVADGAESLASPRWADFWRMLDDEMPAVITDTGKLVGDFTHGLSEMWESAVPTNQAGMEWLTGLADTFDRWASSEQGRADVQAFLDYAVEQAPLVRDFFVETTDALVQLMQAAEPLSGPVLTTLTKMVEIVGTVADSDLGTPIFAGMAALSAYNRTLAITARLQQSTFGQAAVGQLAAGGGLQGVFGRQVNSMKAGIPTAQQFGTVVYRAGQSAKYADERTLAARQSVRGFGAAAGAAAAPLAGLALATTDLNDSVGASNTEIGLLLGTLGGPWGVVLGGAVGAIQDATAANDGLETAIAAVQDAAAKGDINALRETLRTLREEQNAWEESVDDWRDPEKWLTWKSLTPLRGVDTLTGFWNEFIVNSDDAADSAREVGKSALEWQRGFAATPAATHVETFTAVFNELEGQIDDTARASRGLRNDLADALGFLDKFGLRTDYAAAIDDVTDSLEENGKSFDENKRKGQANQKAIEALARTGLQLYDALDGKRAKAQFLDQLRDDVRSALKQFDLGNAAVRKFLEDLQLVDRKKVTPEIDVDTKDPRRQVKQVEQVLDALGLDVTMPAVALEVGKFHAGEQNVRALLMNLARITADPHVIAVIRDALNGIGTVRGALASLHDKEITVTTRHVNVISTRKAANDPSAPLADAAGADGLTVPGPRLPYRDKVLIYAAPGEEIISNRYGQADQFRADRAAGIIPAYANGGNVGSEGDSRKTTRRSNGGIWWVEFGDEATGAAASLKDLRRSARAAEKQLARSERALDRETDRRDDLVDRFNDYRRAVVGNLRSDPFTISEGTTAADPWAAGAVQTEDTTDVLGNLRGDIKAGREYRQSLKILQSRGVRGSALGEVDTLEEAQALLGLGKRGAREYQRLYGVRARVSSAAGADLGEAIVGQQLEKQTAYVADLSATVKDLRRDFRDAERRVERAERRKEKAADRRSARNARDVANGVNKAAAKGYRDRRPRGIGGSPK